MVLTLVGGPHAHCHFACEAQTPPERVLLQGPNVHTTAVYTPAGYKFREPYSQTWLYELSEVTWEAPPELVRFDHAKA